jgi:hypothetical protein
VFGDSIKYVRIAPSVLITPCFYENSSSFLKNVCRVGKRLLFLGSNDGFRAIAMVDGTLSIFCLSSFSEGEPLASTRGAGRGIYAVKSSRGFPPDL